jgi:hypothetical protein
MEIHMRSKYIVLTVALSVGAISSVWSADEPAPTPAPAAQATASSTADEAAAKAANDAKAKADAEEKRYRAAGYKKKTQNGQTFYCRKETPIGQRFETEFCQTPEEMAMRAQQGKDFIKSTTAVAGSRN